VEVGAADAARWEAKRAFFDEMAKAQLNRRQAAVVACWQAMGVHFSASAISNEPGADVARWVALGERYSVEFPNLGHFVFAERRCARNVVTDFLSDPTTAPDSNCTKFITLNFIPF